MRDVKDQRAPLGHLAHDLKPQHIDHQVVVAKAAAPFADHQTLVAALTKLGDDVSHLFGAQKLGLFNIDHRAGARHRLH